MESLSSVTTRVSAGASRWASRSETNSLGRSAATAASASSSCAVEIDQRRAKGLIASRFMRLPAETTPRTRPSASTTGRWFTPACIISMLASGASICALTVLTGAVMIAADRRLGGQAAGDDLLAQVGVGDDAQPLAAPDEERR